MSTTFPRIHSSEEESSSKRPECMITVRLSNGAREALKYAARRSGNSLNGFCVEALMTEAGRRAAAIPIAN